MNVGAVCSRDAVTVTATAPLLEAARLLCGAAGEGIVVIASPVNRPTAIGVITDRDIVRSLFERGGHIEAVRVVDILSRNPLVLSEDEEVLDAMARMQAFGVQYAPVIGAGGVLCGAVSQRQLLGDTRVADWGCTTGKA